MFLLQHDPLLVPPSSPDTSPFSPIICGPDSDPIAKRARSSLRNSAMQEEESDEEWEDEEEDEESRAAVDRVLNKYEKAPVMDEDKDGDFDARYEWSIKEKMDEWKRGYYKVRTARICISLSTLTDGRLGQVGVFV